MLRWAITWALTEDPDRRIVYASYAAGLARLAGRVVRSLIHTHGLAIGLAVATDHADAADWGLEGHRGGLFTTGRGSLTGRPADWLVMDDLLRDQQEATSAAVLGTVHEWWESVARTRLAPGAPAVMVATRWAEDDPSGRRISEGWPLVNIPAVSDGDTPDALDRPVGEWLVSARGTTAVDWERIRAEVGERTWASLYQGRPAPLEGGVFKHTWFDTWRVDALPAGCDPPTVVVDPADNEGDGDEAGIILASVHRQSGKVYILDDLSAPMTVARWARVALLACVRRDAPKLAYEQSLSQLPARIRDGWQVLHQQALALANSGSREEAIGRLSRADDRPEQAELIGRQVDELSVDDVAAILRIGGAGPGLSPIVAKGTKESRMLWAAPLFETGRAVLVGRHAQLEHQAATWQPGSDSPDRVDAAVHACKLLDVPTPRVRWM